MKQWFKRFLWTVLGVAAVLFIAATFSQNYLVKNQANSLNLLANPQPLEPISRDGTAALYLLLYRTQNSSEINELFSQYQDYLLWNNGNEPTALAERKIAANLRDKPDWLKCDTPSQCVQNVANNPTHAQQWRNQHQAVLENITNLNQYDGYEMAQIAEKNWGNHDLVEMNYPDYFTLTTLPTANAVIHWHEGKREQAVLNMCSQADLARKLQNSTHQTLINAMVANAMLKQSADYLAYFIQQQPEFAHKLPESCVQNLQPQTERTAQVLCSAMKGESLVHKNTIQRVGAEVKQSGFSLFYNENMTIQRHIRKVAHSCTPAVQQQIMRDEMADEFVEHNAWIQNLACVRNVVGCILLGFAEPAYTVYPRRLQDGDMQLRAFQAALTLAKLPETERKNQAESVLKQWSSEYRPLYFNFEENLIEYTIYAPQKNQRDVNAIAVVKM